IPLKHSFGIRLAKFFSKLGKRISFFKKVASFFETYSNYLGRTNFSDLVFVFFLALISWFFEFLALHFTFLSLGIDFGIVNVLLLLVIVAVLERTPILPRGIGMVELIGFSFLSLPFISPIVLDVATIGALLIAYDFVRLVMPAVLSLGFNFLFRNKKIN
ncbi:MAG: lysylphosphatidylglycerol synthase domain-containing protein, partial [Candidatus Diapherotrites archaeon]|nr:lysylphosphatidylglycerol synthase domain-containing protein [Candidatus Diapherotrites archaeon]